MLGTRGRRNKRDGQQVARRGLLYIHVLHPLALTHAVRIRDVYTPSGAEETITDLTLSGPYIGYRERSSAQRALILGAAILVPESAI